MGQVRSRDPRLHAHGWGTFHSLEAVVLTDGYATFSVTGVVAALNFIPSRARGGVTGGTSADFNVLALKHRHHPLQALSYAQAPRDSSR
jgi:hypothetical protein